jgi:hypothetical protein
MDAMNWLMRHLSRLMRSRVRFGASESGQSIIILALGFVGLVGFVGIVTDISLMLVRYNTLSRAVDSAALSAANQMRSDRSFAEVGLAARMMLELHGIDADEVLVETCASTDNADAFLCSQQNRFRKLVRIGARIESPTIFLQLLGFGTITLSAVSTSETAVLDIVMMLDVSESMLQDTSYADWASIGMGQVYVPPVVGDYGATGVFQRERAENHFPVSDPLDEYDDLLQMWGEDLIGGGRRSDITVAPVYPSDVDRRLYYTDIFGNAVQQDDVGVANDNYYVRSFPLPGSAGTQLHPREACRVRFWPYSVNIRIPQQIREMPGYAAQWQGQSPATFTDLTQPATWGGFAPTYDFYGCCNDPTSGGVFAENGTFDTTNLNATASFGDFNFSDLICQPFKQARDATREFLKVVDFDRGDRVAFVTFDRTAFLIDPDGVDGAAVGSLPICPRDPDPVANRTSLTHMMASYCRAVDTLDRHIGVRADPNFYLWKPDGGGWSGFARGLSTTGQSLPVDYYNQGASGGYDAADRPLNELAVRDFCPYQNAAQASYLSRYSLWDWDMANPQYLGVSQMGQRPGLYRTQTPNPADAGWGDISESRSYELWASCRGTNIGAGLREANNALLDPTTTRRAGTVWVMVMLSDGAAGASDPVRLNANKALSPNPYFDYGADPASWQTWQSVPNVIRYGQAGEYGAYGLCPIGTPTNRSQLTRDRSFIQFPYCSDEQPQTRHFCTPPDQNLQAVGKKCDAGGGTRQYGFAPGSFDADYDCNASLEDNLALGNVYDVDIGAFPNETAVTCDPFYDVDDYARDWADYVGLSRSSVDEQLPTVFTIAFGLNFQAQNSLGYVNPNEDPGAPDYVPKSAAFNVQDFLGEELLRYIADVGDNAQIDSDYQQDWRQDRQIDGVMSGGERFGPRGPCEDPNVTPTNYTGGSATLLGNGYSTRDGGNGTMVRPLPPRQDCGNYYNAPDQARLGLVFDDIASRMFTRLAP